MWFLSDLQTIKPALSLGEEQLSYIELRQKIQDTSKQLKKLPRAVLILNASFDFNFIIQLFAALNSGQPVALFSTQWSQEDREEKVALLGDSMSINHQGQIEEFHENDTVQYHPELALILFTSGSTGQVKAVQLSQRNIESNSHAVINALEFTAIANQLLFLPLSYSFGLLGQLIPALMSGASTQLVSHFTEIKAILEQGNIPQMWSGVPSHWVAIDRMAQLFPESAAQVSAVVSAGAPLAVSLRKELRAHFPNATLYNNYGLTEASPRVLTYSSRDPLFMEDYAGYPVGDWQIKCASDGELLIQGSQMMLGYLGEEVPQKIQEGWMHTGDLAEILPSGLVAIKGRRDHLVNVAGEKVNLAALEDKIRLIQEIKEVVVVPVSDTLYGVRIHIYVEQNPLLAQTTEQALTEKIQAHLLPRKIPVTAQFIDKIPRNQHGKVDRTSLMNTLNPLKEP